MSISTEGRTYPRKVAANPDRRMPNLWNSDQEGISHNFGGKLSACRLLLVLVFTMGLALTSSYRMAKAAEGASSHFLPGSVGDIFLAMPPKPGFLVANTLWYQSGNAGAALLEGAVNLNLDIMTLLNLTALTYTFEQPVLGGTYTIGVVVPIGYASLDASITGPLGGRLGVTDDSFDLSDIALIPIQLNWASGAWSFKLSEIIVAPTGGYSLANLVNLGRNYWSFDTVGAITWFDPAIGLELSVAPGIMVNTENSSTNYRTGTEFHVDFTANQFLSPSFALGVRGYYYHQLTGDSGSGALLGGFRSDSFGAGPGFVWIPEFGGGDLTVLGKWMHDFTATNRFESDYVTITGAWSF